MAYSAPTTAQNKAALDYFIQLPVSADMISYLAQKATQVIRCEQAPQLNKNLPPTPPTTPPQHTAQFAREAPLPTVEAFITSIVERSHVQVPTLMTSLVYLSRLKSRLPPVAKGMRCTVHRIFLASLILAAKNLNDSSPKNKHWARYTAVRGFENFGFSITEVNLMEKQLLFLLDWDLRINPEDLYQHLEPFLAPIRIYQARQAEKARVAQKGREILAQQQYALNIENFHRSRLDVSAYDSPKSFSSYAIEQQRLRAYPTPSSSSRAPSRTPSLSPPLRSSAASPTDSVSSGSPVSFAEEPEEALVQRYDTDSGAMLVHIQAPASAQKPEHRLPLERYEEKPAKKVKTSTGGFFNRVFGSAGAYSGRSQPTY